MATAVLSLEEFLKRAEESEARLEFDEGNVIEMASPSPEHNDVAMKVGLVLNEAVAQFGGELVATLGTTFILDEGVARIPDLYVARRSTRANLERRPGNFLVGAPELVIEIISPSDSAFEIDRKVRQYLGAGAKSVWAVYFETRHVMVYREGAVVTNYEEKDRIVETVFDSELAVTVSDLFADL